MAVLPRKHFRSVLDELAAAEAALPSAREEWAAGCVVGREGRELKIVLDFHQDLGGRPQDPSIALTREEGGAFSPGVDPKVGSEYVALAVVLCI